jgi:hypothetical protein
MLRIVKYNTDHMPLQVDCQALSYVREWRSAMFADQRTWP